MSIHKYEVNSGVQAIVHPDSRMVLSELGNYHLELSSELNDKSLAPLVDSMSDISSDETTLADDLFGRKTAFNPIIGRYLGLYAGHVTTDDYRLIGSSGGMATWILVRLLQTNHIDGVIHMKETAPGDATLFRYSISTTVEEIKHGAKSRYYPGELSGVLAQAMEDGKRYAITGIPSFISEVRLLSLVDPRIKESIRYYIGLICGHQKSTKYAEALAWQYGIQPGDLQSINFRKKDPEGRASRYLLEMTGFRDGKLVTMTKPSAEPFVSNWGHGFFKPLFSDFTDDALNETADVALGDAWLPEYDHDGMGNNIVISREPVIHELIQEGINSGDLHLDEISEETIIRSQAGLVHHTHDEIGYRLHKEDATGKWRPQKRVKASNDLPFLRKKVQDVRSDIAAQSHILYKEALDRNSWEYFERKMTPLLRRYSFWYKVIRISKTPPRQLFVHSFGTVRRKIGI